MKAERIVGQSLAAAGTAPSSPLFDLSKIKSMPGYNPKHLKDILELVATVNPLQRRRRPRIRKRDPNRIPRPVNCFLAYRLEKQKLITAACAGVNHREISKAVAKWWSEEPEHEKEKYRELAEKDKQLHKQKYPNYKYSPKKKRPSDSKPPQSSLTAAQISAILSAEDPLEAYLCSPSTLDQSYELPFCQTSESLYQSSDSLCEPSQVLAEAPTPVDFSFEYQVQGSSNAIFNAALGDSNVAQNGYNYNVADAMTNEAFWSSMTQPSLSDTPSTAHMSPAYGSTSFTADIPATVNMSDVLRPTTKNFLSMYSLDQGTDELRTGTACLPSFDSFVTLDHPVLQDTDFSTGTLIDPLYPPQTNFDNYSIPFA